MFYSILRFITKIGLLAYYRKIYLHIGEKIPKGIPLIIASNHPNAFTEPLLLTCFMKRRLHFITRSDVFVKKFKWFFNWTHQIPIYRFRDGYQTLKKNRQTFDACHDVLHKQGAILIFSEGTTQLGKSVRPLKKGTAKLALSFLEKYPDQELAILPVGFTYGKPIEWNGDLFINMGPILSVKEIIGNESDIHQNILKINDSIFKEIQKLAIHIEDKEDEEMVEGIACLHRKDKDSSLRICIDNSDIFLAEQKTTSCILADKKATERNWREYKLLTKTHGFNSEHNPNAIDSIFKLVMFVFLSPLAIAGLIIGAIPFWYSHRYINSMENNVMRSGTRIGLTMGVSIVMIIAFTTIGIIYLGWVGILLIPIITFLLFISIRWLSVGLEIKNGMIFKSLPSSKKNDVEHAYESLIK